MKRRIRLEKAHFRRTTPDRPVIKSIKQWTNGNQGFYDRFRAWLLQGGYGQSALNLYSVSARLTLGLLDKPYWQIEPERDLEQVRLYLAACYPKDSTRQGYAKGLHKLAEFLWLTKPLARPHHAINWSYYTANLPADLAAELQPYLRLRQRAWLPEQQHRASLDLLSHLTLALRWLVQHGGLTCLAELTPNRWFDYVDARLAEGISPTTLNGELHALQAFLRYEMEQGQPICHRMLQVTPLTEHKPLPRDVPLAHLRQLYAHIQQMAATEHANLRRLGRLDRAWFLLMLHSGLRSSEVRRLRLADLTLVEQRLRIEQAKGLKDRIVPLSQTTVEAIDAYLAVRGPANTDHLFLFRHLPLSVTYCLERLKTYSHRCGLNITPHQLRHSCATLLLNAGAPILTVQAILGHKHIDTTLSYARLYDGTVAADYYRAMSQIEPHLHLVEVPEQTTSPAHLLALLDALRAGTLNAAQQQTLHQLRQAILTLVETKI
jgi:integrase/recombinase XerD